MTSGSEKCLDDRFILCIYHQGNKEVIALAEKLEDASQHIGCSNADYVNQRMHRFGTLEDMEAIRAAGGIVAWRKAHG